MQTQNEHTDRIFETKIVEEEPVHPLLQNDHDTHLHNKEEVILESHVHDIQNHPQQHQYVSQTIYNDQPYKTSSKHVIKKNYETHVSHMKTNQDKFLRENEKLKRHYEDYIAQLELENKRLVALERELEQLKDRKRIIEADIVKLKTELELLQQSTTTSYEVQELQKQVKKLEQENIGLMDIINIKKNQIIELEENIDVNNTEVELERKKLHERISYLKHQISIKKPEVIVKEVVKEKYIDLPPLEPKIVKKYIAPPVVYQECNCGCICHEDNIPQNKTQSVSYYAQNQHSHHHNQHTVKHQQPLFDHDHQHHHLGDHSHHQEHLHNNHHTYHNIIEENNKHQQNQTVSDIQSYQQRNSEYRREHYGSPRLSELRVTGITETIQRGNDIKTNHYDTEQQYKSATGVNALF